MQTEYEWLTATAEVLCMWYTA